MKILVTGGAGYIGSHTTLELLRQGHQVSILDHLEKDKQEILDTVRTEAGDFEILKADLRNPEQLKQTLAGKAFDAVIHFAAFIEVGISTKQPVEFIDNNVIGTQNLIKVLMENGIINIVFSSSAAVYGTPESVPIREDARMHPENPYGLTKVLTEEILKCYCDFAGLNVVALRYFNPAGSYQGKIGERHNPETHVIPRLLRSFLDESFKFSIFGDDYETDDGTAIRDYIHILDLADAHIKCLGYLTGHKGFNAFNVGTGMGSSIKQVITTAEKITGKKLAFTTEQRRTGDSARLVADPSKIKKEMGWEPKYSLEDIISSAWEWEQRRTVADYA
jgi:UDP-glucose 4-epimerase